MNRPPRISRSALLERLSGDCLRGIRRVRSRSSSAKAVHDTRVSARRLIAAGDLWAPHLPGWKETARRLRGLLRRLGSLRNLDVSRSLLRGGPRAEQEDRHALAAHLDRRRRRERREISDWLTRGRVDRFEKRLRRLVVAARGGRLLEAPDPRDLDPRFERIRELLRPAPDAEGAHAIRRELRRLRYAHETLRWSYEPEDYRRAAEVFRSIQEIAGDWQDCCVLAELARTAVKKRKVRGSLSRIRARLTLQERRLSRSFLGALRELSDLRRLVLGGLR